MLFSGVLSNAQVHPRIRYTKGLKRNHSEVDKKQGFHVYINIYCVSSLRVQSLRILSQYESKCENRHVIAEYHIMKTHYAQQIVEEVLMPHIGFTFLGISTLTHRTHYKAKIAG